MSRSAWIVAASVGAVEALKDQGICRWNYTLRSLHQHAKSNLGSLSLSNILSSSSSSPSTSPPSKMGVNAGAEGAKRNKKREETWGKVVYLDSWGPH